MPDTYEKLFGGSGVLDHVTANLKFYTTWDLGGASVLDHLGLSVWSFKTSSNATHSLSRGLSKRQMKMSALTAALGNGMFIATGIVLAEGGPGNLLTSYAFSAMSVFLVLLPLCEMAITFRDAGGIYQYAHRFIHPVCAMTLALTGVVSWLFAVPLAMTIAVETMRFVFPGSSVILISTCILIVTLLQLPGVKAYGELDYVIGWLKISAVFGVFVLGIVTARGGADPATGIDNPVAWKLAFWHLEGGPFVGGFVGFASAMSTAIFAFTGTELVGLKAAEAKDPSNTIIASAKQSVWRVVFVFAILVAMPTFLVSAQDPGLFPGGASPSCHAMPPLALAFYVRWPQFDKYLMVVFTVCAISSASLAVYSCSRTFLKWAQNFNMQAFARVDNIGRPIWCVLLSLLLLQLSWVSVLRGGSSNYLWDWYATVATSHGLFCWMSIAVAHLRFRRAWKWQDQRISSLFYVTPWRWTGPVASVLIICLACFGCCSQTYATIAHSASTGNVMHALTPWLYLLVCYLVAVAWWKYCEYSGEEVQYYSELRWYYHAYELDIQHNRQFHSPQECKDFSTYRASRTLFQKLFD